MKRLLERTNKKVAGDGDEETKQKRPGKVGRFEFADGGKFVQLFEVSNIDVRGPLPSLALLMCSM